MDTRRKMYLRALPLVALLFGYTARSLGQLNSSAGSVALTATLGESITLAVTPGTMTFALVAGGVATGNTPISITSTWVLAASRANLVLDAYFSSATAALSTAGPPVVNIPSSEVLGQMTTGTPTSYTAFTQTGVVGASGAGLALFTVSLNSSNRAGTRTDNLSLEIDLSSQPQLAAGVYTGTVYIQAQSL